MKKLAIFALALVGFAACQKPGNPGDFTLKGQIGQWNAPAMAYFIYFTPDGEQIDSTAVVDGKFEISGNTQWPMPMRMAVDYTGQGMINSMRNGDYITFYIGEGKTEVTSADSITNATIKSTVNNQYQEYLAYVGGTIEDITKYMNDKIDAATDEERADSTFYPRMNEEFRTKRNEYAARQREYAKANPGSYFSVVALTESSSGDIDPDEVEPILRSLDADLQQSPNALALQQRIDAVRNIIVGNPAPDFTQNTVDGVAVSLSDFKGKYVLLDFWASWCSPCRAESPYLVRAIETYGDKGFEVLGVSLDKESDRDAWIKAMQDDGYTWTNVSDLRGWNNEAARLYGVRAIPQNYLIGPDGVIVATNLRGEELLEHLAEIFV